ncbi:hypothetical protein [Nakamurella sp.]|uniref:hypothetical protein n=1 Tax=Nakamurella sp. TaxID=1869182 RepID=UPI003B3B2253
MTARPLPIPQIAGLAVGLWLTAACRGPSDPPELSLLRAADSGPLPLYTESGTLTKNSGCVRLRRSDRFERSLIFLDDVPIEVAGDRLRLGGTALDTDGPDPTPVTLELRDGPVLFDDRTIRGALDRQCNQTAPSFVVRIEIGP